MIDRFLALQLFIRVARTGSFSVAGRDVGLSQPSASRIVTALEKDVGVALFTRTTRGVTLTEAGSDYLIRAEAILAALEEANHAARGTGELRGLLRVALSTSFAVRTVLPHLSPFTKRHPKLRIEFTLDDAKQDLVGDSVDVALRIGTLADTSAVARKIGVNPRVLAAAPVYLAEAGTPKKPSDLPQHSIIVFNGAEGATAAAVAGLGIISSGALSMLRELESGQLVRVLPDWEMGMADIHVVLPAGRAAKPSARAFADFVSSELREQELVWDRICPGCLASGARSAA
jgi:DNA-binding transcriptional LysR family regulator